MQLSKATPKNVSSSQSFLILIMGPDRVLKPVANWVRARKPDYTINITSTDNPDICYVDPRDCFDRILIDGQNAKRIWDMHEALGVTIRLVKWDGENVVSTTEAPKLTVPEDEVMELPDGRRLRMTYVLELAAQKMNMTREALLALDKATIDAAISLALESPPPPELLDADVVEAMPKAKPKKGKR